MYSDYHRRGNNPRGRRPYYPRNSYDNGRNQMDPYGPYHDNRFDDRGDYNYSVVPQQQDYRGGYYRRGYSSRRPYNPSYRGSRGYDGYDNRGRRGSYPRRSDSRSRSRYFSRGRGRYDDRGYHHHQGRNPPPYTDPPKSRVAEELPAGLSWTCDLEGHTRNVNCLAFDLDSGKLFSGGADGRVRRWDSVSGQVEHTASYSGEVTALVVKSGFLIVAVHTTSSTEGPGSSGDLYIHNLEAGSEQRFVAHTGRILALHTWQDVLLSAGEDREIKGWRFEESTMLFTPAGSCGQRDGHRAPVQCLCTMEVVLFSGDAAGTILAWNLENLQLVQKLDRAHDGPISGMLIYENSLITASIDSNIRMWSLSVAQGPGNVIQVPPRCSYQTKNARGYLAEVISLFGTLDRNGRPLLFTGLTCNEVAFYGLPNFEILGRIKDVTYPQGLADASGECLFIGLGSGTVTVYGWDEDFAQSAEVMMF